MKLLNRLSPTITNMIRLDHTHVFATYHQFEADSPPRVKKGLVDTACTALEIHAKLEEEVFYPALAEVADSEALRKAVPEHNEMRRLIAQLRGLEPTDATYDDTFHALMREVIHHVADEETQMLPAAERLLADQLHDLGAAMNRRRLQLVAPRSGEIATGMARSLSPGTLAVAAGVAALAGGVLLSRRATR